LTEILAILQQQKNALQEKFGVLDLAVFGSYVNHTQIQASNVDLFVDLKPEYKTFDNYMELRFFLEEQLQKKMLWRLKNQFAKN